MPAQHRGPGGARFHLCVWAGWWRGVDAGIACAVLPDVPEPTARPITAHPADILPSPRTLDGAEQPTPMHQPRAMHEIIDTYTGVCYALYPVEQTSWRRKNPHPLTGYIVENVASGFNSNV